MAIQLRGRKGQLLGSNSPGSGHDSFWTEKDEHRSGRGHVSRPDQVSCRIGQVAGEPDQGQEQSYSV